MDKYEKLFYITTIVIVFFGFGKIMDLMLTLIALNIPYSTMVDLNPLFYGMSSLAWLITAFILIGLYGISNFLAYEYQMYLIQKILLAVITITTIVVYYAVFNNMWVLYVYLSLF